MEWLRRILLRNNRVGAMCCTAYLSRMNSRKDAYLPAPPHFSFAACAWFLDRGMDDCMHTVRDGAITKAIATENELTLFRLYDAGRKGIGISVPEGNRSAHAIEAVKAYVYDWLDLGRDLSPFYSLLRNCPPLAYMASEYDGLRMPGIPDLFEALCWSIIGQQINLSFAYRLKRRIVEQYGRRIRYDATDYFVFPGPAVLAGVPEDVLRGMQCSQRKASYLTGLASVWASGAMSRELLEALPDFPSRRQALTALRGVGVWTANYALMKSLRMPEAIPWGDAGLLQALLRHGLIADRKDQAAMDRLFTAFRGWESYLVLYLWRSLAPYPGQPDVS